MIGEITDILHQHIIGALRYLISTSTTY